jgi:hypothetical protein
LKNVCLTLIEGSLSYFFGDFTDFARASNITGSGDSIRLTGGNLTGTFNDIGGVGGA